MSEDRQMTVWRVVEGAAAVLVLGFFLYATRGMLNPFFLFLLLWAVLVPFRGKPGHAALVSVTAVVTVAWLLYSAGSVLAPFILAILLAYSLDPLVDHLERLRLSRQLAMLILSVAGLVALAVVVLLVLPAALRQLGEVLADAPVLFQRLAGWIERERDRFLTIDLPLIDELDLVQRLEAIDSAAVVDFLQERREALGDWLWAGVLGLGRGLGSAFTILGYVAITPILTFYLLRDWDKITALLADFVPLRSREAFVSFGTDCNVMVARYLRGQVTVAIAMGIVTGVGLWVLRFPYAGMLGVIVAVFSVVPYLGLVLSLVPAVLIALASGSIALSLLKVAVVYGGSQLLESGVISPRIVGESVGLHPVSVLLALSLGGFFFGFVGLLIGVPLAAITKLLLVRGIDYYKASEFYSARGGGPGPEGGATADA